MISRGSIQGISMLTFSFAIAEIKEMVKKISALYAKDKVDEEGNSIFPYLVITDDDDLLMNEALVDVIPHITEMLVNYGLLRDNTISRDELSGSTKRDRAGYIETVDDTETVYWDVMDYKKASDNLVNKVELHLARFMAYDLLANVYNNKRPDHREYFELEQQKQVKNLSENLFYLM